MKLLIISSPPFSDSDFPLIKSLRENGHEVWYIIRLAPFMLKASILDFGAQDRRSHVLPAAEFPALRQWSDYLDLAKTYVSNDTVGKTGIKSYKLFKEEVKLIKEISPAAICYIGIPYLFHFFLLLSKKSVSTVVIHDPVPHSRDTSLRAYVKRKVLPCVCKRFVILNKKQKIDFCKLWGLNQGRVFVSSLGAYDCYRKFISNKKIDKPFILFWGRFAEYKGIDYAISAFDEICDFFPGLRFIIAGNGPMCFDIKRARFTDRFEVIHRYLSLTEIADYASQCEFVVCPYTDATQSGVIQTAFAMGAPVVATNVGNFSDVIVDGKTGLLVPPRNAKALSEAFMRLLNHPEELKEMRSNVAKYVNGTDSWNEIAQNYIKIFSS